MSKRIFSGILVSLLLIGMLTLAFDVRPALAQVGEIMLRKTDAVRGSDGEE